MRVKSRWFRSVASLALGFLVLASSVSVWHIDAHVDLSRLGNLRSHQLELTQGGSRPPSRTHCLICQLQQSFQPICLVAVLSACFLTSGRRILQDQVAAQLSPNETQKPIRAPPA